MANLAKMSAEQEVNFRVIFAGKIINPDNFWIFR